MSRKQREMFETEMSLFERQVGADAAAGVYLVFTHTVRWLRSDGHGDVKLSAINHRLGSKIRVDTVLSIDSPEG